MNRSLLALLALSTCAIAAPDDILRFTNGDQLHGQYLGIDEGNSILWTRADLQAPLSLKSENIRHIILRGATPQTAANSFSYVTLQNGDQIPGEVVSSDDKDIVIRSSIVGEITLPTESVSSISPNPFGGKLKYAGPFSTDGWEVLKPEDREPKNVGRGAVIGRAAPAPDQKPEEKKPANEKEEQSWQHSGSAWYHLKGMHVLARKDCLGDSTLVRFRMGWRERLSVNIALHADFSPPPEPKKKGEGEEVNNGVRQQRVMFFNGMPSNHSSSFGNALVLSIYQSYFSLTRCGFDSNGQLINQRMLQSQSGVQLPESGEATIEIRTNREKGLLILFINGQYAAQWEDLENLKGNPEPKEDGSVDPPLGSGFAIQCNNPLRFSDMILSEWSGIKDSAYSLSHEKRDIVLLSNGTDRYSGEITQIKDQKAYLKNTYSSLEIPLDEVAEIVFAKTGKTETKEPQEGTVTARFYPNGKISGIPMTSKADTLKVKHSVAKDLTIHLSNAISLEFSDENPFLETMEQNQENLEIPKK